MTNSIRPDVVASLLLKGEAQVTTWSPKGMRLANCAVSSGKEPNQSPETASGGWRWNGRKIGYMKQGDLNGDKYGVHGSREESEELAVQESERSYERGSGVTPVEQRDAGRWMQLDVRLKPHRIASVDND